MLRAAAPLTSRGSPELDGASAKQRGRTLWARYLARIVNLMRTLAHVTSTSSAEPARFFARWVDHDTWGQWSPDTQWVRLDGPVALGTQGRLKPRSGPTVRFTITGLVPEREYTDTSRLPGGRLVFQHLVRPLEVGCELEVRVSLSGPLSALWAMVMGRQFATSAPEDLARLITLVEQ